MNNIIPPHIRIQDICFYKKNDIENEEIIMHYRYNVMEYNGPGCMWTANGQIMDCETEEIHYHKGYEEQN